MDHAGDLGLDPARIAVGGTSAGGNLAAVVARRFRDSGQSSVVAQLLIYPVIDHGFDRPSMRNQKQKYGLTAETMRWFWARYLDAADPGDPDASPIRAEDLSRLPPAIVVTAEFDPLRDEGDEYAEAMVEAGVPVWHMRADGMTHGFCGLATAVPKAAELLDQIGRKLREFIGPRTSVG
jgi:acetyl esterase